MNVAGKTYGKGAGPCHTCREYGHLARSCPKGKGKGKGFKGECWNCGETGHSARFCLLIRVRTGYKWSPIFHDKSNLAK